MRIVLFAHSLVSCWNHGNAHFLRGVCRELIRLGHAVAVHEPASGWSRLNALEESGGAAALAEARLLVPGADIHLYEDDTFDAAQALDGADLVLVHEWTAPAIVRRIAAVRARGGRFVLLFHDTHHRAITAPQELSALPIDDFDGVLAFGEALREVYVDRGWGRRVSTWHEAADTALFRPLPASEPQCDVIWIGNWGDGERTAELETYLIGPIARLGLAARVHGVRYPVSARRRLAAAGIEYRGWLPNHRVPQVLANARATVHVPRGPYAAMLPGIPTIRVFEALACGIPLISAPWADCEGLFPPGSYLEARSGAHAEALLREVIHDAPLRRELSERGLAAIAARHTCAHRARELITIYAAIRGDVRPDDRQAAAAAVPPVALSAAPAGGRS